MSFFGSTFVFDNIPSESYNLYIMSPDGGPVDVTGSSDIEIITEKIFRRPVPYLYGVQQSPVLQFDVSFNSPDEITAVDAQLIQSWLFGNMNYKKLQIVQEDMQDIYFNCFLTNPKLNKIGNVIYGIKARVVCDSPWAWAYPKTYTFTYTSFPVTSTITLYNNGDNNQVIFPYMEIQMSNGNQLSITNTSDNKTFMFYGTADNDLITVDNDLQIVTSNTGLRILEYFNKNWLTLSKGRNIFNVYGYPARIAFTYSEAKKIGG